VVIIGAGNSACDAATECSKAGAEDITLIDVQKPASFGEEREAAEACGAKFRWPCFTEAITDDGVVLSDGEILPADTVIISIGDVSETDFLPETVEINNGYVVIDETFKTTDPSIYAIGDITGLGLITDAIGQGRKVAETIMKGGILPEEKSVIDKNRVSLEYFNPNAILFSGTQKCGDECASCGNCRDCGICVAICPKGAISRIDVDAGVPFEYVVDAEKCIGCGFCAGACPCGIWNLVPNTPMG
jgi:ferredoxin